jgi:hypothetical protein
VRNPQNGLDSEAAKAQANLGFMPPLGGDANGPKRPEVRFALWGAEE